MKFINEAETPARERLKRPAPKPVVQEDKTGKAIALLTQVIERLASTTEAHAIPRQAQVSEEILLAVKTAIADLAQAMRQRPSPAWKFSVGRDRHGMIATIEAERQQYS